MHYTPTQLQAIHTLDRNLQLIACAGSGKTQIISHRTDRDDWVIVDFKSSERAQAEDLSARQLQVYALGFEQLTGIRAHLIEVHNLDDGGVDRQLVDPALIQRTMGEIQAAGHQLRANHLPRLANWCDTCGTCDFAGICRSVGRTRS